MKLSTNKKTAVFDFTPKWRLNCNVLGHKALNSRKIVSFFASDAIVPIRVDITGKTRQVKQS